MKNNGIIYNNTIYQDYRHKPTTNAELPATILIRQYRIWQGDIFEETNISLSLNGDVKVQHKNKQLQSVKKGLIGQTNTEPKNIYKKYSPRNKTDQTKKIKKIQ